MDKRSIFIISAAMIVLACFFQFSRIDGFLQFASPTHESTLAKIVGSAQTDDIELPTSPRETYLIVYDPHSVDSTFARHRLEWLLKQIKKKSVSITVGDKVKFVPQNYRGVLIATGQVGRIKSMGKINDYVAAGGSAALFMHPDAESGSDDARGGVSRSRHRERGRRGRCLGHKRADGLHSWWQRLRLGSLRHYMVHGN